MSLSTIRSSSALISANPLYDPSLDRQIVSIAESFIDKSGVITVEDCKSLSLESLISTFREKKSKFMECYTDSAKIKDSLDYSKCIKEAEKNLQTMENINESIDQKDTAIDRRMLIEFRDNLIELKQFLSHMQQSIPIGPSLLLQSDVLNLRSLATVPETQYYESSSEPGVYYLEPKISRAGLMRWFGRYLIQGGYTGVTIGNKVDELFKVRLRGMCTWVALEESSKSLKVKASIIKDIKDKLDRALLDTWNFDEVETISYRELIDVYGLSKAEAKRESDYIVLFHKKTRVPDHEKE